MSVLRYSTLRLIKTLKLIDSTTLRIPVEIVCIIMKDIDDKKALLNSRLISKDFMDVATPRAFRELTVSHMAESLVGIESLASSPLAEFVSEVTFRELDIVSLQQSNEQFRLALALHIPKFQNLTSMQFSFPDYYELENRLGVVNAHVENVEDSVSEPETTTYYLAKRQQELFFEMLGHCTPDLVPYNLNTIIIKNLMAFENTHLDPDRIKHFLAPLTNFEINILCVHDLQLEERYEIPSGEHDLQFLPFWRIFNPILDATRNLTSLSLTSDTDAYNEWGRVDIFPRLQNLTLSEFLFAYSYQDGEIMLRTFCLETFILYHQDTLHHLSLSDCFIDIMDEFHPWAKIFQKFDRHLKELRSFPFHLSNGNGYATMPDDEPGGRYVNANATNDPNFPRNLSEEQITESDKLALRSLEATIDSRNV